MSCKAILIHTTDKAQSEIATYWDISIEPAAGVDGQPSFNHIPGGGNVLYMDGHVEFVKYSTEYPICTTWIYFAQLMREVF